MAKQDKIVNQINSTIYKTTNSYKALYEFKKTFPADILSKHFTNVLSLPKFKNFPINNLHISNASNLSIDVFKHPTLDVWKELIWTALTLNLYHAKLKKFVILKSEFENLILLSKFGDAESLLTNIENEFGISFWTIKNRMNLLHEIHGLDTQKEYAKNLQDQEMSFQAKILIYLYSVSSEKNISYSYFNRIINKFFDGFENTKMLEYIYYKLKRNHEPDPNYFANILMYESGSSFIDIYETFLSITQDIFCSGIQQNENSITFFKTLRKLNQNIEDYRIVNLLRAFNINIPLTIPEKNEITFQILDHFSQEKYQNVIELSTPLLLRNPTYVLLYTPYIQSCVLQSKPFDLPNNSLIYNILEAYSSMLMANEKTEDSMHYLLKLLVTYSNLSWTNEIVSFLIDYVVDENSYKGFSGYLNSPIFSAIKLDLYGEDSKKYYLDELILTYPSTQILKIKAMFHTNEDNFICFIDEQNFSLDVRNNYLSQYYLENHEYTKLLDISTLALSSGNIFAVNSAIIMQLSALMQLNIDLAMEKLVDFYLNNKNLSALLPLLKVSDLIITRIDETKQWPTTINSPILLYLCASNRSIKFESRMQYAYEFYLTSNGYKRPTDLIKDYMERGLEFDRKIIFYLKEICIPEIMKKSIFFMGFNDIEKERIQICHELTILDPDKKKKYLSEISFREQNLYIKNEISRLEKNKIYVDIRGVKNLFEKELLEDYKRLHLLLETTNYKIDKSILQVLQKLYSITISDQYTLIEAINAVYLQDIRSDEIYDLFRNILEIARDIFVKNEHHGLDVYLSTKIRHGTISNHLRKPLEKEYLITLKDKKSNLYANNLYWENELYKLTKSDGDQVQSYLKTFSKEYDEKIRYVSDQLLQVSTTIMRQDIEGNIIKNENPNAMFQYYFSNLAVFHFLNQHIQEKMNFEESTDFLLQILWEMTDINLKKVRNYIDNDLKIEIMHNFEILQKNIESIHADTSTLKDAIVRAKAETRKSIENLSTWFARMEDSIRNDYGIENAVKIVENTFGRYSNYLTINSDHQCKLKGNTLESFVDIFFNLVNNAIQHCGYQDRAPAIIINIKKESDNILIEIINDVFTELSFEDLNTKLEPIKAMYGKRQTANQLQTEGGTGFYKIEKIITKDLQITDHSVDFGYENLDGIKFYVRLRLSGKDILV